MRLQPFGDHRGEESAKPRSKLVCKWKDGIFGEARLRLKRKYKMASDLFKETFSLRAWDGLDIVSYTVPLSRLRDSLPEFELRSFGTPPNHNERMRMIVRMPWEGDRSARPVAAVSDKYSLVQHQVAATWLERNYEKTDLLDADPDVEVFMTAYGERVMMRAPLPSLDQSLFKSDRYEGGDPTLWSFRPEITLLNSVDRSSALSVGVRWRRIICLNGMWTDEKDRIRSIHHIDWTRQSEIPSFIKRCVSRDAGVFDPLRKWAKIQASPKTAQDWCEKHLRNEPDWRVESCARVWQILETGYDGVVATGRRPGERTLLQDYHVGQDKRVPGDNFPIRSVLDLAQVLTWVSTNQRSVDMQLKGTEMIPKLIKSFINFNKDGR
jgi:hypothetical protein